MRFFLAFCVFVIATVQAWPTAMFEKAMAQQPTEINPASFFNVTQEDVVANLEKAWSTMKLSKRQNGFNAQAQYIPTTGQYAFRPPGQGDQRGNCPGLNALANHGYIPRNGIATTEQMSWANQAVFGLGPILSNLLSVFGSVMVGDLTKFSIGGETPGVSSLLGLFGTPGGMSGANSQNKYENDGSMTRGDLHLYGDSSYLIMDQFKQFFDLQPDPATANYDMSVIIPFHAARWQQSVATNPYFFNAPLSGNICATAGYHFTYRLMANHSSQYPQGRLDQETLKSFFAISGPRSNFVYSRGWERIPNNWYRRPDYYDFPQATADILGSALSYPYLLSVGGNLGRVNSYTGVNLGYLTGGVLNGVGLLQGNAAICFLIQAMQFATPDLVSRPGGILTLLNPVLQAVNDLAATATNSLVGLGCPVLRTYDKSLFDIFPGRGGV